MKTTRVKLAGFLEVISKIVAKIVGAAGVRVRSNLNDIIISSAVSTWRNSEGGRVSREPEEEVIAVLGRRS